MILVWLEVKENVLPRVAFSSTFRSVNLEITSNIKDIGLMLTALELKLEKFSSLVPIVGRGDFLCSDLQQTTSV